MKSKSGFTLIELVLVILIALVLFGAFAFILDLSHHNNKVVEVSNKPGAPSQSYAIVNIDGCEYIEVNEYERTTLGIYSLTHKGNCTNHTSGTK